MVKVRVRGVYYEVHPPHPGSSEPGYVVRIDGDRRMEVWKKGKMPGVQTLSVAATGTPRTTSCRDEHGARDD